MGCMHETASESPLPSDRPPTLTEADLCQQQWKNGQESDFWDYVT